MRGKPTGRPPKSPEFRRDSELRIRLTADERAELDRAADGNTSTWARELLLQAAKKKDGKQGNRTLP